MSKGIELFLPGNLKVDFDSMCNRCPFIDVSTETEHTYGDSYCVVAEAKVSCNHIKACRWAYTKGLEDG